MALTVNRLEELISILRLLALKARNRGDFSEYFRLREEMGLAEAELTKFLVLKPAA